MILFTFTVPEPPEREEGILVNFGTDETGFGMIEPSPPPPSSETVPVSASLQPSRPDAESIITQDFEDAPEVKKVDPEAEKKRLEKIEADRIKRELGEADRIRRQEEEAERKRIEAEQQREYDIANRTKNALAGARNSGTSSTSEGIAGGTGNQGVPTGSIDSQNRGPGGGTGTSGSGVSYNLGTRRAKGNLPNPKYDYQDEGVVVVDIWVDRQGKVVRAEPGKKGSTTINEYFLRVAREAALEAQFDPDPNAPERQIGSITYNFRLK